MKRNIGKFSFWDNFKEDTYECRLLRISLPEGGHFVWSAGAGETLLFPLNDARPDVLHQRWVVVSGTREYRQLKNCKKRHY
jgi:hypothetical protein